MAPSHLMFQMSSKNNTPAGLLPASLSRLTDTRSAGVTPPTGVRPHSVLSFQILPQGPEQMTHRPAVCVLSVQEQGLSGNFSTNFSNSVTRQTLTGMCYVQRAVSRVVGMYWDREEAQKGK